MAMSEPSGDGKRKVCPFIATCTRSKRPYTHSDPTSMHGGNATAYVWKQETRRPRPNTVGGEPLGGLVVAQRVSPSSLSVDLNSSRIRAACNCHRGNE